MAKHLGWFSFRVQTYRTRIRLLLQEQDVEIFQTLPHHCPRVAKNRESPKNSDELVTHLAWNHTRGDKPHRRVSAEAASTHTMPAQPSAPNWPASPHCCPWWLRPRPWWRPSWAGLQISPRFPPKLTGTPDLPVRAGSGEGEVARDPPSTLLPRACSVWWGWGQVLGRCHKS